MNSLKGLGVCAVLAAIAYALTQAPDIELVILYVSIGLITLTLLGYMASLRRRRRDHRVAAGRH
ncbi:hypothetical protein AB0M39_21070 [Streptomyces sp. NPDC051907]|uniref:hypothetical protein n=1 Tax=Streptomyces sp. NPDC051907 TaxID=3155284 RepID=UPI00341C7446